MSIDKIEAGDELSHSGDQFGNNIEKLKKLFPQVVTENKIDFDALRQILGDDVEPHEEYYRFTWAGKEQSRIEAHKPSTGTLRPQPDNGLNVEVSKNVFVRGDNLEVLKLLQKGYANRVRVIYIDPPYNTGKDFVYKDDYSDNLRNYLRVTGQSNEDGAKLSTNSDKSGRYHSDWLSMIYPRLILARNLLKEDGVIYISIDDHEQSNLKKVCDEVFGEQNNLFGFVWYYEGVNDNQEDIKKTHEYILAYAKNKSLFKTNPNARDVNVNLDDTIENSVVKNGAANPPSKVILPVGFPCELETLELKSQDVSSLTYDGDVRVSEGKLVQSVGVTSGWSSKKILEDFINAEFEPVLDSKSQKTRFVIKSNGNIHYLKERDQSYIISVLRNYGTTQQASKLLSEMGLQGCFSFPKPVNLVKHLLNSVELSDDDIVMDFFAGSGTTGEAIALLNKENNKRTKFILVQLDEELNSSNPCKKSSHNTIADVSAERLIRSMENHLSKRKLEDCYGFKAYYLDTSNIVTWSGNPEDLEDDLFTAQQNIKSDRSGDDLLTEILLKYGLELSTPIEVRVIGDSTLYSIGYGSVFICMDETIPNSIAEDIGRWKEELHPETCRAVFRDTAFSDVSKTNIYQTLKRYGISEVRSI